MWLLFTAFTALITLYFSIPRSTRPGRLIPAVSIRVIVSFLYSKGVSNASRVVPAISLTIERSWPRIELISEDFPTLVRPTIASLSPSDWESCSISPDVDFGICART